MKHYACRESCFAEHCRRVLRRRPGLMTQEAGESHEEDMSHDEDIAVRRDPCRGKTMNCVRDLIGCIMVLAYKSSSFSTANQTTKETKDEDTKSVLFSRFCIDWSCVVCSHPPRQTLFSRWPLRWKPSDISTGRTSPTATANLLRVPRS